MCSESAYRSKFAKGSLGAKYRLSREQHVAKKKFFSRLDSNPSGRCLLVSRQWTFSSNSTSSQLYFFPYGIRCHCLGVTWQFHKRSHACSNSPNHNWMSAADLHTQPHLQPVSQHSHLLLTYFSTAWTARSVTPFARRSPAGEFATTV